REWMREHRVLPWMRDRIPLVFCGGDLVAVADIGLSAAALAAAGSGACWRVAWHARPRTGAAEHLGL
ncbi:MAG TPA: tRNA lysidine(34) synthetase TilS, partial [Gammaproteobacteria bacterium]|nr:tRNA lysidine(34) synthetase TilS [Gammaproteobacteria bacterium]